MNKLGRVSEVTKGFNFSPDNSDGKRVEVESGLLLKHGILSPAKVL